MDGRIATPFPLPQRYQEGDVKKDIDGNMTKDNSGRALIKPDSQTEQNDQNQNAFNNYRKDDNANEEVKENEKLQQENVAVESNENDYEIKVPPTNETSPQQEIERKIQDHEDADESISKSSIDSETDSDLSSGDDFEVPKANKIEEAYLNFMQSFAGRLKSESELAFEFGNGDNSSMLYSNLFLINFPPELVTSNSLENLKIHIPRITQHYDDLDDDDENITMRIMRKESIIQDYVLFLLRTIQSYSLKDFTFINDDDSFEINGSSRMSRWHNGLQIFLRRHSSTLKKVTFHTVPNGPVKFRWPARKEAEWEKKCTFSQLEDLEIIFWEPEPDHNEPQKELYRFWLDLVKSRADQDQGELKRFVWMSSVEFPSMEILVPTLKRNQKSLETVHILCSDPDGSQIQESDEQIYISISCSTFSEMPKLTSLYFRKSRCFLHRMDLLPQNLTELALDGLFLESSEIILALQNLCNLKKLRLVNNDFSVQKAMLGAHSSLDYEQAYGVNLNVIKAILQHRKLDEIFIWRFYLADRLWTAVETINANNYETVDRKTRSKMQQLKSMCSSLKTKLTRSKGRIFGKERESQQVEIASKQTVQEILEKIAKMDQNSIVIQRET